MTQRRGGKECGWTAGAGGWNPRPPPGPEGSREQGGAAWARTPACGPGTLRSNPRGHPKGFLRLAPSISGRSCELRAVTVRRGRHRVLVTPGAAGPCVLGQVSDGSGRTVLLHPTERNLSSGLPRCAWPRWGRPSWGPGRLAKARSLSSQPQPPAGASDSQGPGSLCSQRRLTKRPEGLCRKRGQRRSPGSPHCLRRASKEACIRARATGPGQRCGPVVLC